MVLMVLKALIRHSLHRLPVRPSLHNSYKPRTIKATGTRREHARSAPSAPSAPKSKCSQADRPLSEPNAPTPTTTTSTTTPPEPRSPWKGMVQ